MLVGKSTGGGFETLKGNKTHYFISTTKALQNKQKLNTRPLSFSSVSFFSLLYYLSHTLIIAYIYTQIKNKKKILIGDLKWLLAVCEYG
jgi:hypothetical protein